MKPKPVQLKGRKLSLFTDVGAKLFSNLQQRFCDKTLSGEDAIDALCFRLGFGTLRAIEIVKSWGWSCEMLPSEYKKNWERKHLWNDQGQK